MPFSPKISTRPLVGAGHRDLLPAALVAWRSSHPPSVRFIDPLAVSAVLRLEAPLPQRVAARRESVFSSESGFSTKSNAPSLIGLHADSMLPCPEIRSRAASICRWRACAPASAVRPDARAARTSSRTRP